MIKIDNIQTYLNMLEEFKNVCRCDKRQVSCFIIKNNSIISSGVNGTPVGYNNTCEEYILPCTSCGDAKHLNIEEYNNILTNNDKYEYCCKTCGVKYIYTITYLKELKKYSKDIVIHAEENAILKAVRNHIPLDGSEMICTTAPCINCAKKIHAVGISKVYYKEDYKNTDGIRLLTDLNIEIIKVRNEK